MFGLDGIDAHQCSFMSFGAICPNWQASNEIGAKSVWLYYGHPYLARKPLGLYWHLFKALVLPTFTWGTEIWGGTLKNSHWKAFEKGMKIHSCQSVFFNYLSNFVGRIWRIVVELYALKLIVGFHNDGLPTYPPPSLLLVSRANYFPNIWTHKD
jgi:hypothetical protein